MSDRREDGRDQRPRVLVLGGGFGGIGAARKLAGANADVVLVDQNNYHTFQPLLYQVATDLLDTDAVGHALRDLFHDQPNVTVHQGTVTSVDVEKRTVEFADRAALDYDYLVVALGATVNFFGTEGADEHGFPMYTLADAVRLKEQVLERWEAADRDPSLVDDGALNVVVVGGGPTGVESVGALAELYRSNFAEDYPQVPQEKARLILVEAGPTLFAMFKQDIRDYTKKALEERGVEVLVGESVASVAPTRVTLESGKVLEAHTLVWGAGLQASERAADLPVELQRGHRVPAEPDLSLAGHPEVFVVGDVAWITDSKTKRGAAAARLGCAAGGRVGGREHRETAEGRRDEAVRLRGQGDDGDDRSRRRGRAVQARANDEGKGRVARLGGRASRAAFDRGGSREGRDRLDLGRVHA